MFLMQRIDAETAEERFGSNVSARRTTLEMSQRSFAAHLTEHGMPVDASAVSRIENGTRSVRLVEALTIAEVLKTELSLLIAEPESPSQVFWRLRTGTDVAFSDLVSPLKRLISLLGRSNDYLRTHPELVADLHDGDLVPPSRPSGYLEWVARHLELWKVETESPAYVGSEHETQEVAYVIGRFSERFMRTVHRGESRDPE